MQIKEEGFIGGFIGLVVGVMITIGYVSVQQSNSSQVRISSFWCNEHNSTIEDMEEWILNDMKEGYVNQKVGEMYLKNLEGLWIGE